MYLPIDYNCLVNQRYHKTKDHLQEKSDLQKETR